jgi:membrane protease YdiL (CAAX protease family)
MKAFIKPLLFLLILSLLEVLLRKGFIASFIPFNLPQRGSVLLLFSVFAVLAWLISKWFSKTEKKTLDDLGISLSKNNRLDFFYGFWVGVGLWALVSLSQSVFAGFSWVLRPDINPFSMVYGLLFIFIADLGTELYTRGYPLFKLKESFGAQVAIIIMVFFVGLKSFSFNLQGELLFYSILIPALHTVFFSIIYFKTKRLGAALGIHTGANFVSISVFDLRVEQVNQAIPAGIFQSNVDLDKLSIHALQLPWVFMAFVFSVVVFLWWRKKKSN